MFGSQCSERVLAYGLVYLCMYALCNNITWVYVCWLAPRNSFSLWFVNVYASIYTIFVTYATNVCTNVCMCISTILNSFDIELAFTLMNAAMNNKHRYTKTHAENAIETEGEKERKRDEDRTRKETKVNSKERWKWNEMK